MGVEAGHELVSLRSGGLTSGSDRPPPDEPRQRRGSWRAGSDAPMKRMVGARREAVDLLAVACMDRAGERGGLAGVGQGRRGAASLLDGQARARAGAAALADAVPDV